jgi:spore maturation protein CgeB
VSFVGNWRPEREALILALIESGLSVHLWGGTNWNPAAKRNQKIRQAWRRRGAFGAEYAAVIAESRISLNVIDPTNYPAANMRFFEIAAAGGVQLCSDCPEFDEEFKHLIHTLYFTTPAEAVELANSVVADADQMRPVAAAASTLVAAKHTYKHRVSALLAQLPDA